MKKISYILGIIILGLFASCGGKKSSEKEEIVLTPETTQIKGDLGDYFEVIDKNYTVTNDWGDIVTIEIKRTDKDYAFDLKGVEPYGISGRDVTGHAGFGIEILDENGNVIEKKSASSGGLGGMYSSDDMEEALKLKPGETGTVRWSFSFNNDNKPVKFRLTSAYETVDSSNWDSESSASDDTYSSSSDDEESYSNTSYSDDSGSEDWDALLNSYEQYVDKYISLMKKASNGDMSALTEYPALLEKAEEFDKKLSGAKSNMSASQMARYMKITNKMIDAAK